MLRNFKIKKDQERSKVKYALFEKYFTKNARIIDVGTGSGQFAQLIKDKDFEIQAVDVVNKTNASSITPIIYNGRTLPFENNSFDISMLITVLHHCPNPENIFKEAVRVSKSRIFVLEDVYSNKLMKYLTWGMDSLMNLEFFNHPHTNKSEEEWEALFKENKLLLIYKKKVKVLFIFTQVVYVLDK